MATLDRRTKILVVDDDEGILNLAAEMLDIEGYEVLTATDGMKAILVLSDHDDVSLLFTDIKMPKIDGILLADMAKMRRPKLNILYATGFGDEVSSRPGVVHGEILPKPYSQQHLADAIKRALLRPPW